MRGTLKAVLLAVVSANLVHGAAQAPAVSANQLVREAGGLVTDKGGHALAFGRGDAVQRTMVCAGPILHAQLLERLRHLDLSKRFRDGLRHGHCPLFLKRRWKFGGNLASNRQKSSFFA